MKRIALISFAALVFGACQEAENPVAPVEVELLLQSSIATCPIGSAGLVSSWPGDGSATDIIGVNEGTLQGVTFAPGFVGQAFSLDGVDDFVDVPDSPSLDAITSAITVDAWIKPETSPSGSGWVFARRDALVSEGFGFNVFSSGALEVSVRTTTSPTVSGSIFRSDPGVIAFDQLQHVAVAANTATGLVKAYVNGLEVDLHVVLGPAMISGSLSNVNHLFIGRRQSSATVEGVLGANHYKGLIDELELFSRDLAPCEIRAIFGLDAIANLIATVQALEVQKGIGTALGRTLQAASNSIANDRAAAIQQLEAFINQVNALRGGPLGEAEADELVALAQTLIAGISGDA